MPEAAKQVALADRIVLTKSDLADAAAIGQLTRRIAGLTQAPIGVAEHGAIAPAFVLDEPPAAAALRF